MKQGEILKEYANTKKISVAQMGRDLERERSQVYQLFKTNSFSESVLEHVLQKYPDFSEFETKFNIIESRNDLGKKGYNQNPIALNDAGQTILMKLAAANSYAILDLLAELVSEVKKVPIEGVKQRSETKARDSLRSIEDNLLGLISS